jgi:hypothetical protein
VADTEDTFARLRLIGGRFDGAGMPVEALGELVAYQDLVVGVAKEVFRAEHPDRQRLPSAFGERLQLRLGTVEQGSVMPVLERPREPGALMPVPDEFTRARDIIEDAIAAAETNANLPASFPRQALVLFNRFGQTLHQDEAIELRRGNAKSGPRYTQQIRRRLVLETGSTVQDEVEGVALVLELNAGQMTCMVRFLSGSPSSVRAPVDELTFAPLKEAMAPNGNGPLVHILGVGVYDKARGLIRLDSIHDVSLVDEESAAVESRLCELEELGQGWLDGDGAPVAPGALRHARETLADLQRLRVPQPRLYPTPEGGVQAEWTSGRFEISITFEPDGSLYAVGVDTASGDESELESANAKDLAQFVLRAK